MLETNRSSGFKLQQSEPMDLQQAINTFDRAVVESVSTGGIAMRPAALGENPTSHAEVYPKKKKRWYLKYFNDR